MSTTTPNMNLVVPTVGSDFSPNYALEINQSLSTIDQHNHSPGSGVQITPAGININSALTFNSNNITNLSSLTLVEQVTPPIANGTMYESAAGDIHYINGSGLDIQITNASGVNVTPTSIPGLVSPASVEYVPGDETFVWESDVNIAANMDFGSALLRNLSPNSTFALTLTPPTLTSNFTITLPYPATSGATTFVTINNSGTMSSFLGIDSVTIITSSNNLAVGTITAANIAALTITAAQIANNTITATQIANGTLTTTQISSSADITAGQLASPQQGISNTSGSYTTTSTAFTTVTNQSVTVTGVGRPIDIIFFCNSGNQNDGYVGLTATNNAEGYFRILNTTSGAYINTGVFQLDSAALGPTIVRYPLSSMNSVDTAFPSGSQTYVLQVAVNAVGSSTIAIQNCKMAAIAR